MSAWLRDWNWRRLLITFLVTFIVVRSLLWSAGFITWPYVSLEVLGWCFSGFLAVFAVSMLAYVLLDEFNGDWR